MPATEDYFRSLPKMHRWFAGSMLVLLFATMLMMYFDHHDEWRAYQKQWFKIEAAKITAEEEAKKAELAGVSVAAVDAKSIAKIEKAFAEKLEAKKTEKKDKQTQLEQVVKNLSEFEANAKKLANDYLMQMRVVRSTRADRDVARADYDLGIRDQVPAEKQTALKTRFTTLQEKVAGLENELDQIDAERNKAVADLKEKTADRDKAEGELKAFQADIVRLDTAKDRIAPDGMFKSIKRAIMEWPIIDGFNSHMKIQQDWLPDMKITLGMSKTARFDRCRTCHLAIDRVGPGEIPDFPHGDGKDGTYQHPFSTHPRMDVYLSASSPHPLPEFGCTSCHDGQGSATSFTNASHTPNDPHQAHEWEHEFGWFNNHFWEYPMQPERLRESSCLKCHHSVVELGQNKKFGATAPKVYEGWQLIKKYGCFGCHEINGFDAGKPVGPDLRLEPQTPEEEKKIAEDSKAVAGLERKVGPSLRYVASKTTQEWLTHWTEEPKRFRPTTAMPQFFNLSNNSDAHGQKFSKLELAAIAHFLFDNSKPLKLDIPSEVTLEPDAVRGEKFFAQKGCLACHSHDDDRFKGSKAEFGPNLSKIAAKIKPGEEGFNWLYTWIREPHRHHKRTKMPDLFLDAEKLGDKLVDPAADIAKFLLDGESAKVAKAATYEKIEASDAELDVLVELLLARRKTVTPAQAKEILTSRNYLKARVGEMTFEAATQDSDKYQKARDVVKGDEIELIPNAPHAAGEKLSDAEWRQRKLSYLGRVTISRYGCYGCHDIPKFETARPIGTALQDWGLKDPSRLAPEHIEEYLHHHGEPDGSSTKHRVEEAIRKAAADDFKDHEEKEKELGAAFFYESLLHHGRPGFIWQKLRDPRSYDFEKAETKFYDERLRMPKFPLNEKEIEAISTFVLGLVARPPAEKYQYRPKGAELAKLEGEKLLQKFNCTGCHIIDLPEIAYGKEPVIGFVKSLEPPKSELQKSKPGKPKSPEELRTEQLDLKTQQVATLREFFGRVAKLADDVQSKSQLVYVRGVNDTLLKLIDKKVLNFIVADDFNLESNSAEKWNRTTERLQKLSKFFETLPEPTKFTVLSESSFEPFATDKAKENKFLVQINKGLDDIQKDITERLGQLKNEKKPDDEDIANRIRPLGDFAKSFAKLLDQLVMSDFSPNDHLDAVTWLQKLKPPRNGVTKDFHSVKRETGNEKLPVVTFRGLPAVRPKPDDEPEEREYGYDLWETLNVDDRLLLPGSRITVSEASLVKETPARGGQFAEWLVDDLLKSGVENRQLSWQSSPPPLYLEGLKVQTPWLYSFLKNPYQIRHTTVLRMPKFNMSEAEAQVLANYFAAYDGTPFPYQDVPQREPEYLSKKDLEFNPTYRGRAGDDYLHESWRVIGAPICSKCHAVGGRKYKMTDPKKDIQGPNLDHVANRLQPDWMMLWLLKPSYITPYTSMPVNFPPNQNPFPELFKGVAKDQTTAVRDALLNYQRLMEREGRLPELQVVAPVDAKPAEAKKTEGGGE